MLGIIAAGVSAQPTTKPGPMQSGQHADTGNPASSPVTSSNADPVPGDKVSPAFDVRQLFATTCGWCHSAGGREAGKGPQLMNTTLTDGEIAYRIRTGKVGQMPSYKSAFNDDQIKAIIQYIRALEPATQ